MPDNRAAVQAISERMALDAETIADALSYVLQYHPQRWDTVLDAIALSRELRADLNTRVHRWTTDRADRADLINRARVCAHCGGRGCTGRGARAATTRPRVSNDGP